MRLRLGDLSGDERLRARSDGGFKVALRATRAPRYSFNSFVRPPRLGDRTIQHMFQLPRQHIGIGKRFAIGALAQKTQVLLTKAAVGLQPQPQPQLGVIAQRGVRVQRQMVGKQVDVVRQQTFQPLLHPAGHPAVLAAPEQAVVHKNRVGTGVYGRVDQRAVGRHTADQFANAGLALDLQPIGAVVLEALGLHLCIKGGQHGRSLRRH